MELYETGEPDPASALHVREAARYLLEAQECARFLLGLPNAFYEQSLIDVARERERRLRDPDAPPIDDASWVESSAAGIFKEIMNERLTWFHVRLIDERTDRDAVHTGADLIDVLYLQLANLIVQR
jgi:hypothetical protein